MFHTIFIETGKGFLEVSCIFGVLNVAWFGVTLDVLKKKMFCLNSRLLHFPVAVILRGRPPRRRRQQGRQDVHHGTAK